MAKEGFSWDDASGFQKFLFCLGWLNALNLLFWVVFLIVFAANQKKHKYFFNNITFMVPYIFGWIIFVIALIGLVIAIIASIIIFSIINH